jgi:lipopolysaccharide transport system ATP-binding protein
MAEVAIRARGLGKCYRVYDSPRARLMHALAPSWKNGVSEIWALRGVDLEVARGESVAIIGRNGGGKSTLLQILTGTLVPTEGDVAVNGRVSALLELGSGFNPEYTGRDNVMMNGLILGLTREEIARRFDEIAAFAEIGDAMDRPVKTYSTGMLMRLAFAVQVLTDPEILVIDEALSVGDFFFQQKCLGYIRGLLDKGVTLVFVSHDMGTVRDLCKRAVYLRDGTVAFAGETRLAIRDYMAQAAPHAVAQPGTRAQVRSQASRELDELMRDSVWRAEGEPGEGRLLAVAFYDESGAPATTFKLGSTLRIRAAFRPAPEGATHVAIAVWNKFNQVVTSVGSSSLGVSPPEAAGSILIFEMTLGLVLEAGNYSLMVSLNQLTRPNRAENLDATPQLGPLVVQWDYEQANAPFLGMVGLPAQARFTRAAQEGEAA